MTFLALVATPFQFLYYDTATHPGPLLGSPILPPVDTGGRSVKLTTRPHLVPNSRKVELSLYCPLRPHGVMLK
jgi:hypothetical protein